MSTATPQAKYRNDYQAPNYRVTGLYLDVALFDGETLVSATSQIERTSAQAEPLFLDGEALELVSLEVNGVAWSHCQHAEHGLTLRELPAEFTLKIVTRIHPEQNSALMGLYKSGAAYCTQCEAEGFRRITYYLDRPDVLTRFKTRISADKGQYPYLLSNGNPIARGDLEGGRHFVEWEDPFFKPAYLFALVAGDFDVERDTFVTRSGRSVQLEIFVDKGNLDRARHALNSLKLAMRWDEERFGLEYDLDIYMVVAVDFFNMGAMENKGLNVFNSKFVLANAATATDLDYFNIERVIGHEYFHNWTGNRITCRDWFQLSLKEGLTVFRDQEFSSDVGSRAVNRINNVRTIRGPQFAEDGGPMAHPIRPDVVIEMNNFYTLTVYEKGSEVIRMIHTLLGEEMFQAGMRLYVERHDGHAATCEQFVAAMEDASGIDLTQFRRWYSQSGTPELTVRDDFDAATGIYRLHVSQLTKPTLDQAEKLPLHIPLSIALYDAEGNELPLQWQGATIKSVLNVTEASQTFSFDGLSAKPIVALLQEFSAPVKLDYPYQERELAHLIAHARNGFIRWDATQMLINQQLRHNVPRWQQGQELEFSTTLADALLRSLQNSELDNAFKAELLTLPSEATLAELFEVADIDAIHAVRKALRCFLAKAMQSELQPRYQALQLKEYRIVSEDMGKRALKGVMLNYLTALNGAEGEELVKAQYQNANNMTDTLTAMQIANDYLLPCRGELLADFAAKWGEDGLVLDNWLRLVGSKPAIDVLDDIAVAMRHPTFSMKNPNRVRALIGAFSSLNPVQFHALDGRGYRFLGQILRELNEINPQVAARLITPLIQFQRLDAQRKALIKVELEQLAALPNLARDLFEKIGKALQMF